jgi:hypothetical protein
VTSLGRTPSAATTQATCDRFATVYDAWCDRAFGLAVAATNGRVDAAAELVAVAWSNVWHRWAGVVDGGAIDPDDTWMQSQLRLAIVSCATGHGLALHA